MRRSHRLTTALVVFHLPFRNGQVNGSAIPNSALFKYRLNRPPHTHIFLQLLLPVKSFVF